MITIQTKNVDAWELRLLANYLAERSRICQIANSEAAAREFAKAARDVRIQLLARTYTPPVGVSIPTSE